MKTCLDVQNKNNPERNTTWKNCETLTVGILFFLEPHAE
jgi:hypothetical protein